MACVLKVAMMDILGMTVRNPVLKTVMLHAIRKAGHVIVGVLTDILGMVVRGHVRQTVPATSVTRLMAHAASGAKQGGWELRAQYVSIFQTYIDLCLGFVLLITCHIFPVYLVRKF